MSDPRLRLAVFIDFDNIEIGVKNTLNASFDAGIVLEALKERGDVVSKTAYSDWQRAGGHSRGLTQHAIKMVQRNLTPGGDKNGADINLALDALEMAFTHPHINAFVIVGGDSDFISLVEKLKQYDKKVFIVGGRQFTSAILQRNCHEFIAYENLMGASAGSGAANGGGRRHGGGRQVRVERTPIEQAIPLVQRALAVLTEREVSPQLGLLKSTLLQLDSTFSERNYGAGSFRDFVDKLAHAGVLRVYQGKGGWTVEASSSGVQGAESRVQVPSSESAEAGRPEGAGSAELVQSGSAGSEGLTQSGSAGSARVIGTPAEGIAAFRELLGRAQIRRWPMYLRNVKQVLRQAAPALDERAYGFGTLVDLLRAAAKEGIVRVDRDRQGVIRVFQGATPVAPPAEVQTQAPTEVEAPVVVGETVIVEAEVAEPDLSVGPGNVEQPALIEPARRRGRGAPRARATGPRRPRKKAE
jgi:uncharacterized LabA/DUF88 family protein